MGIRRKEENVELVVYFPDCTLQNIFPKLRNTWKFTHLIINFLVSLFKTVFDDSTDYNNIDYYTSVNNNPCNH